MVHIEGADKLWELRGQLAIPPAHVIGTEPADAEVREWLHGLGMGREKNPNSCGITGSSQDCPKAYGNQPVPGAVTHRGIQAPNLRDERPASGYPKAATGSWPSRKPSSHEPDPLIVVRSNGKREGVAQP